MNILGQLRARFEAALAQVDDGGAALAALVLPSQDAKFGDYQANCAMPLAKRLGRPPHDVAAEIVARLDVADMCDEPEIAGPGFINLRLRDRWLCRQLADASDDVHRLGIAPVAAPRTFVIDYSSPNVAKPMHVGHIRSTVIGDCLYRVLRFLGHRMISDNHIGDWGTQFGMIIYGYKNFRDFEAYRERPVEELSRLYRLVNQLVEYHAIRREELPVLLARIADQQRTLARLEAAKAADEKEQKRIAKDLRQGESRLAELREAEAGLQQKLAVVEQNPELARLAAEHPNIGEAVLQETARLHAGDRFNHSLWEEFLVPCVEDIEATYERLGVSFNHSLGESFYHDRLEGVVEDLLAKGIATESEGAICVFLEGFKAPFIVRKRDGAFLYATTDLATIQYRMEEFHPDAILYVVDHRQSLHFEQLFATARAWGYSRVELAHVSFGTVLGEDGRPFKTRSGAAVGLMGLLDEAVERAYAIVCSNDDERPEPLLSEKERRQVAERIGIGAIKYADLAHNRTSDYVFSYDKMLAMNGNTAAYMQYSYARVKSIFAKGDVFIDALRHGAAEFILSHPAERALAIQLLQFAEALDRVAEDYRPNQLTAYLFELASRYSEFFENCPVLKAESETLHQSRLLLCDLTARTIQQGLALLGIDVVERM
jgi:arginyl-tRNA synthetase